MSDLYDSLEDDNDENKASVSLDRRKTDFSGPVRRTWESDSKEKYSFFLNRNVNTDRPKLMPIFQQFSDGSPEEKIVLPKISSCEEEGAEPVPSIVVDNQSLLEQGLQFNNDGSFTKSPRPEKEELPFITREYRNLQFQKRKTYALNKKISLKSHKKNAHSFANAADRQVKRNQIGNNNKKKGSSEEVLMIESSLSSKASLSKVGKKSASVPRTKHNHNLTDSMKEKLLKTLSGKQAQGSTKESPKKQKRHIKNLEASKSWQQDKISTVRRIKLDAGKPHDSSPKEKLQACELDKEKPKFCILQNVSQKIPKFKSDILLNSQKPRLNYWERHQLESGYNPFFLRQESKNVPDDTNRSNFGDSVMEDLSEVSYRVLSCDNLGRDEEEMFYRDLIQKEKTMKQAQRSSRSEGPLEFMKRGINSCKSQKETLSGGRNGRSKNNSKSMFIDMPSEGNQSKKCSHYCSSASSSNLSKVELALKARTYGYLVNARNIFKLKAQAEGRFNVPVEERNEILLSKPLESSTDSPEASVAGGKLIKQNSLPVNIFPTVKAEILRKLRNHPRASASWSKEKQTRMFRGSQKGFVLPQVNGGQQKVGQMNARLFQEINSCLNSPNI